VKLLKACIVCKALNTTGCSNKTVVTVHKTVVTVPAPFGAEIAIERLKIYINS
jgi:hypothetical protein